MSFFFPSLEMFCASTRAKRGDVHFLGLGGLLGRGTTAASRLLLYIPPFGFFTFAIAHCFSIVGFVFMRWIMSLFFPSSEMLPERSEGMR